jgi:hypothetical protein
MKAKQRIRRAAVVSSDPEWEKMKTARRSLDHDDAIQRVVVLHEQYRSQSSNGVGGKQST